MVGAVDEDRFHIDDRVSGQDAGAGRLPEPLLDRLEVLTRQCRAGDFRFKLQAAACRKRFEPERAVAELAVTASLPHKPALRGGGPGDGFAVRNTGSADSGIDAELPAHSFDYDFEVKFAHAREDDLAALLIARYHKRGVFVGEPEQRSRHLFLVAAGLGFDSNRQDRIRECDLFE